MNQKDHEKVEESKRIEDTGAEFTDDEMPDFSDEIRTPTAGEAGRYDRMGRLPHMPGWRIGKKE